MDVGQTWNESQNYADPLTGRRVSRLSTQGRINQTPTYHTNAGFTADGCYLAFASVRGSETWIIAAEVETGLLKLLWKTAGVGDRNYIHRGMSLTFTDVDAGGVCGNRVCMAPQRGEVVFCVGRQVLAVDIATATTRVLLADCGPAWIFGAPCLNPAETHVAIALSSAHPEMIDGGWTLNPNKPYRDYQHQLKLLLIPLDGSGQTEVLYEHPQPAQSAHCAFCPTDANLLYFDLDLPPGYWGGGDGQTPRIWLLDLTTRQVRPLKESYPGPFQTHQVWLWDGSAMAYHGRLPGGGEYFGIAERNGHTRWERLFPQTRFYGHHTPDARRPALIIDGTFADDRLQWLYYDDPAQAEPHLEPICLHNTTWGSLPGQYSHPHPLTDPGGQWVSFTAAKDGRSDVYVVSLAE